MRVVQIVPRAAVEQEGVGGYAHALGGALGRHGCEVATCVAAEGSSTWAAGPEGTELLAGSLGAALIAREADAVLLHYSGYGYAARGAPSWLARELTAWRLGSVERRLVAVFHEVYATGPPWRSSFWFWPRQRRVAASLARHSDALWTSLELYARALRPWVGRKHVGVYPVFSTVGEPSAVQGLAGRPPRLMVFGGAGVRRRTYDNAATLVRACKALEIEQIVDVGPPVDCPKAVAGVVVETRGVLPANEVSRLLLDCRAGFLTYEPQFLPKSTIFAAYAAHGLLPVCASRGASPGAEVRENQHYWEPDSEANPGHVDWQTIADLSHGWYASHSLELQADSLRTVLT